MQRFIMDCPKNLYVDHLDGDSLNNKRDNLCISTNSENLQNRVSMNSKSSSGVRGVSFSKSRNKWEVKFRKDYKTIHFGRYNTFEEAKTVAEASMKELFPYIDNKYKTKNNN